MTKMNSKREIRQVDQMMSGMLMKLQGKTYEYKGTAISLTFDGAFGLKQIMIQDPSKPVETFIAETKSHLKYYISTLRKQQVQIQKRVEQRIEDSLPFVKQYIEWAEEQNPGKKDKAKQFTQTKIIKGTDAKRNVEIKVNLSATKITILSISETPLTAKDFVLGFQEAYQILAANFSNEVQTLNRKLGDEKLTTFQEHMAMNQPTVQQVAIETIKVEGV